MNIVNAISKVRFASAKAQQVQLHAGEGLCAELLCVEPGQQLRVSVGEWTYYVVTGTARLTAGDVEAELPTGQLAATTPGQAHTIANPGEHRLVCLAIGTKA